MFALDTSIDKLFVLWEIIKIALQLSHLQFIETEHL
jgi:hypothetical protein